MDGDVTKELLSRLDAMADAIDADGWLELPPKIRGSLATARSGYPLNTCFDLGLFENMVTATIDANDRSVRDHGPRYTPIAPAKVRRLRSWLAEMRRLRSWLAEMREIRRDLTAIVSRQADAAKRAREEADRAKNGRRW